MQVPMQNGQVWEEIVQKSGNMLKSGLKMERYHFMIRLSVDRCKQWTVFVEGLQG